MNKPASLPGPGPSNPSLHGVHEAMHKAAATARRRAARTSAALAASERTQALLAGVDEGNPAFDDMLGPALQKAEQAMVFVVDRLYGLSIPGLGDSTRLQLAAGCLHLAIEHGQSIVVLTQDKCFGSVLALQRPLYETLSRGWWLRHAATDEQVDDFHRDECPTRHEIVDGLERVSRQDKPPYMTGWFWNQLCSYTHGGYQQIGARLTTEGIRSNYTLLEVMQALRSSGMVQLAATAEFASMADDESLATTVLERLEEYARSATRPPIAETDA